MEKAKAAKKIAKINIYVCRVKDSKTQLRLKILEAVSVFFEARRPAMISWFFVAATCGR